MSDSGAKRIERAPIVWVPWVTGPQPVGRLDHVLVSFTEFRADRARTLPGVFRWGLRLRQGWFATEGAVGLLLWTQPTARRGGSLSVWRDEEALKRFVRLPLHAQIIRQFRDRVRVRSVSWTQREHEPAVLKQIALPVLSTPPDRPLSPPPSTP